MGKFITGLPNKMAFFVRAGHLTDTQTALTSSKMAVAKRTIIVSHDRVASSLNAENQDNAGPRK
jgi:hypothetical protein